jgi:hypothetical protein
MTASRTAFRSLVAALVLTLVGWVAPAAAVDYCVYHIVSGFFGLTPELNAGDIICVDCPASLKCPGPSDVVFTATIKDASGNQADGRLRKADDHCVACPANGKTGYEFVNVPRVGLVEDDIDWTTSGGLVHFHLRFRNTDLDNPSMESFFDVFVQPAYGAHLQDGPPLFHGIVQPMPAGSFFDVFFDIPLPQLPPSAPTMTGSAQKEGPASAAAPCEPGGSSWAGNIDVTWGGPGGSGMVGKHLGTLLITPGGATRYIHLLTGCVGPISWSLGPSCSGFSVGLVNEDFTPAPALLPPTWTGWICVSAAASVVPGTPCCTYVDMTCGFVPAHVDFCATACTLPTAARRRTWSEVKLIYR